MTDFHFIRPSWLLALIPAMIILIAQVRRKDAGRLWRGIVADHLLSHVLDQPSKGKRLRPHVLLGVVLILTILALAGPAWVREPAPFADDTAALVIAIEVTPTMMARDIQPSRLERAAQKIKDLQEKRKGAKTALVAYSGSAHLVMPLTEDGDLIADFAAELDPSIMPAEGDAADRAVSLAQAQLTLSGLPGSVLLVTDSVPPVVVERIRQKRSKGAPRIHVYGIAAGIDAVIPPGSLTAPALDNDNLKAAADAGQGSYVTVTPDGTDVDRLARIVETQFTAAANPEGGDRWRDYGYGLIPLIALFSLWWFRPGWTVSYNALNTFLVPVLVLGLVLVLVLGSHNDVESKSQRVEESESQSPTTLNSWTFGPFDLSTFFQTVDQKAQRLFNEGKFTESAALFTSPARQGTAWYRAGEFEKAAATFGRTGTAEGMFNRGNALMLLGEYEEAIKSYQQVLQERPKWKAAAENLNLAQARLARLTPPDDAESQKGMGQDDEPDEIVFDDRAKNREDANTETVAGTGEELDDKALRALWLRRVQTNPADFLRIKFAYQYRKMANE